MLLKNLHMNGKSLLGVEEDYHLHGYFDFAQDWHAGIYYAPNELQGLISSTARVKLIRVSFYVSRMTGPKTVRLSMFGAGNIPRHYTTWFTLSKGHIVKTVTNQTAFTQFFAGAIHSNNHSNKIDANGTVLLTFKNV